MTEGSNLLIPSPKSKKTKPELNIKKEANRFFPFRKEISDTFLVL